MDHLQLLMNAAGASGHSPKEWIQRELLRGVLIAGFGLAWAIVLVGMIALTATLALEPEFGAATAAALTTGGLLLIGAVAALSLRGGKPQSKAVAPAPQPVEAGVATNGDVLRVHSAWDVATLVAIGILTGLQQRR